MSSNTEQVVSGTQPFPEEDEQFLRQAANAIHEERQKVEQVEDIAFIEHQKAKSLALQRSTAGSVGHDLYSVAKVSLEPFKVTPVPLGFTLVPPKGYYGQILSKSSWALKNVVTVGGVIDPDYRGEVCVLLFNFTDEPVFLDEGDCCGQMVFLKCTNPTFRAFFADKNPTERGDRGVLQLHKKMKLDEEKMAKEDKKIFEGKNVAA
jgi:dUTP pyrophosphatase